MGKFIDAIQYAPEAIATYVIATSDATAKEKAQSDLVLTGTSAAYASETAFQALLTAAASGDTFKILGHNMYLTKGLTILSAICFDAEQCVINYNSTGESVSGTGYAVTIAGAASITRMFFKVRRIVAKTTAVSSANAGGLRLQGVCSSRFDFLIRDFNAGIGIQLDGEATGGLWIENNDFHGRFACCKYSVAYYGETGGGVNYNNWWTLEICNDEIDTIAGAIGVDFNSANNTGGGYGERYHNVYFWPQATAAESGFSGAGVHRLWIGRVMVDTGGSAFTLLDNATLTTDTIVEDVEFLSPTATALLKTTDGYLPLVKSYNRDGTYFPTFYEPDMMQRMVHVPITFWQGTLVKTTNGAGEKLSTGVKLNTSTTNPDMALYPATVGWGQGSSSGVTFPNWAKNWVWIFQVQRTTNDTASLSYVQVKAAQTHGALAAEGIGMEIRNLDLYTQAFGSGGSAALENTDFGVDLTLSQPAEIAIVHLAGVSDSWYVNGVLKRTLAYSVNTSPSLTATEMYLVASIAHTSTANAVLKVENMRFYIEK